jgi:tRNA(Arg) A34 adenosine deaminase TadA
MNPDFMRLAIRLALENVNSGKGGPFAALVAKDGQVIATGTNQVTISNDPTAHAEVAAIREACRKLNTYQLSGCDIYTTCEPCPMCMGAIYWARPARVFYASNRHDAAHAGFDDSLIYSELQKDPECRRIPVLPLLRDESLAVFEAWKHLQTKVSY